MGCSRSRPKDENPITPDPKYPMRNKCVFDNIEFDSCFESGNLANVKFVNYDEYEIWITPDNFRTESPKNYRTWFYFRISNFNMASNRSINIKRYKFKIKNMSNKPIEGMKPVYRSNVHTEWAYIPLDVSEIDHNKNTSEWVFLYDIDCNEYEVYFAYAIPYTYTNLCNFLNEIEDQAKNNKELYFKRELASYSLEKNKIELITITGNNNINQEEEQREDLLNGLFPEITRDSNTSLTNHPSRPLVFEKKLYVLITGRSHPSETPANYIIEAFIKSLMVTGDKKATFLLENFVFVFVPMLNPDGVIRGHHCTDTLGKDLNRHYDQENMSNLPGPYTIIRIAHSLARQGRLYAFIDIHSHSNLEGAFLLGNIQDDPFAKKSILKFIRLYDIYSKNIDYTNCNAEGKLNNLGIARQKIGTITKCPLSFTLEMNFHRGTKDHDRYALGKKPTFVTTSKNSSAFTLDSYKEVGITLGDVLLEMIDKHPNSILAKTWFQNNEELDKFVIEELKEYGDRVYEMTYHE